MTHCVAHDAEAVVYSSRFGHASLGIRHNQSHNSTLWVVKPALVTAANDNAILALLEGAGWTKMNVRKRMTVRTGRHWLQIAACPPPGHEGKDSIKVGQ